MYYIALARLFHSVGARVILASRDLQKLQALKFQLDNSHVQKDDVSHTPNLASRDKKAVYYFTGTFSEDSGDGSLFLLHTTRQNKRSDREIWKN